MELNHRTPSDLEDFSAMARQLAQELAAVLNTRHLHSGVLLAALIDVHYSVVMRLNEVGQQSAAVALRSYSDALLSHCALQADITAAVQHMAAQPVH